MQRPNTWTVTIEGYEIALTRHHNEPPGVIVNGSLQPANTGGNFRGSWTWFDSTLEPDE